MIRRAAAEDRNVIFSNHVNKRILEREISDIELRRVLRTGHVMEEPTRTKRGEWKCKVIKQIKGTRDAGVVTIILHNGMLFIKTVEWEDFGS